MPVYITVAPEALSEHDAKRLVDAGATLALGHTTASYEESDRYLDHFAGGGTHIFNAMSGVSGRDPGLAGALLNHATAKASLIADGYHVHGASVRLALSMIGIDRLFLISDGMPPLGGTLSSFSYGSHAVTEANGRCTTEDGVLAGTAVSVSKALLNVSEWTGEPVEQLLPMVTSTPAARIGATSLGVLEVGAKASLAVWSADHQEAKALIVAS